MTAAKGYYALVQYRPDASRLEAANIGVILLCPERGFLEARFAEGHERIRRFFGPRDWQFVEMQKRAVKERLAADRDGLLAADALRQYAARLANEIVITEPRFVRVEDPADELASLFEQLVGSGRRARRSSRAVAKFREAVRKEGLEKALKTNHEVNLPGLKHKLVAPFAYQNGQLNLIEPQRFDLEDEEDSFDKACRLRLYAEKLQDRTAQTTLIVVAQFAPADDSLRADVTKMLKERNSKLYDFDHLEPLFADIRKAARHRTSAI